jgi:hypothetical protein
VKIYGMCSSGKVGYLDEIDAMLSLLDLQELRDGFPRHERNLYPCDICGHFHLTSGPVTEAA